MLVRINRPKTANDMITYQACGPALIVTDTLSGAN